MSPSMAVVYFGSPVAVWWNAKRWVGICQQRGGSDGGLPVGSGRQVLVSDGGAVVVAGGSTTTRLVVERFGEGGVFMKIIVHLV